MIKPPQPPDVRRKPYSGRLMDMPEEYRPLPVTPRFVIAGTGHCGTTLLNRVLHRMPRKTLEGKTHKWSANSNEYPILNCGTLRWDDFPGPVIKSPFLTTALVTFPYLLEAVSGVILPVRDDAHKVATRAGKRPPCKPEMLARHDAFGDEEFQDYLVGRFVRTVLGAGIPLLTLSFPGYLYEPLETWAKLARFFSTTDASLPDFSLEAWQEAWGALYEERPH